MHKSSKLLRPPVLETAQHLPWKKHLARHGLAASVAEFVQKHLWRSLELNHEATALLNQTCPEGRDMFVGFPPRMQARIATKWNSTYLTKRISARYSWQLTMLELQDNALRRGFLCILSDPSQFSRLVIEDGTISWNTVPWSWIIIR